MIVFVFQMRRFKAQKDYVTCNKSQQLLHVRTQVRGQACLPQHLPSYTTTFPQTSWKEAETTLKQT